MRQMQPDLVLACGKAESFVKEHKLDLVASRCLSKLFNATSPRPNPND